MSSLSFNYLDDVSDGRSARFISYWRSSTSEITLKIRFIFIPLEISPPGLPLPRKHNFRNVNDLELLGVASEKFRYFITTIIGLKFVNSVLDRSP